MAGRTLGVVTALAATVVAPCAYAQERADMSPAQGRANLSRAQDIAVTRAGRIPGLGAVTGSIAWGGRQQLVLADGEFEIDRSLDPITRESTIRISGKGETPLTIRLGGPDGFSIARGGRVVRGTSDVEAIRQLLGGRAVAAFREKIGGFERRLMADPAGRTDDPHAYGFLLVGALVGSLEGDPAALGRARDLIVRRTKGRARQVRFDFRQCVQEYERYLLQLDTDRTNCLEAANGRSTWYARAADRLACEVEFMAGALAGEGQFISCTALGAVL